MNVQVVGDLSDDVVIWRYMGLDKFVNLLEDSALFFSPLSFYEKTDPFEGYPPAKIVQLMYSISDPFYETIKGNIEIFDSYASSQAGNAKFIQSLEYLRKKISERPADFRNSYSVIAKSTLVNCWHASPHESEAMWKLYGESHKGVAIRSTVGDLRKALEGAQQIDWVQKMFLGQVRYLDYADPGITPKDCLVGGIMTPLLKRISFAHEKEIRAFFVADVNYKNFSTFTPKPYEMKVDVSQILGGVYISPYVDISYGKAIRAVCRVYGLKCNVIESNLLKGEDSIYEFLSGEV